MTAPVARAPGAPLDRSLARDTAVITALNLLSRLTGFGRVVVMAAALGATSLGDTYQAANLVSNILFELLAGGLLSAVLVPVFVERLQQNDRHGAAMLARALLGRALLALGVVVVVLVIAREPVMQLLTVGAPEAMRDLQIELGTYLLVFFLPQILLYAAGAVATALLQAERRFVAAAFAPVGNNIVVIVTMLVFRSWRGGDVALPIADSERLLLALGTTGGVVAMTVIPLVAVARVGMRVSPGWSGAPVALRPLLGKGMWAAGHLGLNQLLVAVTIVLAAQVEGGVVAYQIAWTFFLLPHALLANPVYTALFPRLAADASAGESDRFADDVARGLRITAFLVVPAAGLLAALARPSLAAVRLGNLDADGADLVAAVLATYAVGLLGYSAFFLLTRASYALDDARAPTVVNLVVTAVGIPAMIVASGLGDGDARVVVLGLVHAVVVSAGSIALFRHVRSLVDRVVPCMVSIGRAIAVTIVAAAAAWWVGDAFGVASRADAVAALVAGGVAGAVVYVGGQLLFRAPELHHPLRQLRAGR